MKKIYLSLLVLIFLGCEEKSTYDNSSINKINEGNLHRHIQILASDEYGGRAPGSPGGEKTKQYISQSFKDLSIEALDKNFPVNTDYLHIPLIYVKN